MKKLVLLIMAILFSTLSISEVDYKELLKDYPYKNSAVQATVLGTPKKDFYVFKDPKGPKIGVVKTTKKIPDVLRQWENYEYGIWKQKEKAPLMVIISGTGSLYNGSYALYMANVFYDRGYNVLTFSSTSTLPYIVSQSTNSYSGNMTDEVYDLYDIIANEIAKQKKDGMDVSDTYIGGFSLGGFQSLKIHELDSQKKKINIKKSLLLNTPVDILTSSKILDNYLVKNGIYDASTLEKYIDTIFKKILFDDSIQMKDMNPENIQSILARSELGDKDLEVMIGLLFRFYSANMTFSGEMFEGKGDRILKGNKPPKRFDSLTNYFLEGLSVSYAEYSEDILYPYVNKRLSTNTYTYEKFKEMFSLKSSSDFIKANGDNIIYLTSADDLLMTKEDFAYVNSTFKNKIILPYGGHTGILWHKEVSKLMVDKLEEGGTK